MRSEATNLMHEATNLMHEATNLMHEATNLMHSNIGIDGTKLKVLSTFKNLSSVINIDADISKSQWNAPIENNVLINKFLKRINLIVWH